MLRKKAWILGVLIIAGLVTLASDCCNGSPRPTASATDPNETNISDGKDFKSVKLYELNDHQDLKTVIEFYSDFQLSHFFYYIDQDADPEADIAINCYGNSFEILGENPDLLGVYDVPLHNGTPTVSGSTYTLIFPWDIAFGIDEGTVYIWFFAMAVGDRMPDEPDNIAVHIIK